MMRLIVYIRGFGLFYVCIFVYLKVYLTFSYRDKL